MARRVLLGALVSVLLLVGIAIVLTTSTMTLRASVEHLVETNINQVRAGGQFDVAMTRAIGEARELLLDGDASEAEEAEEALDAAATALAALDPSTLAFDRFDQGLADEYRQIHAQRGDVLASLDATLATPGAASDDPEGVVETLEELEERLDEARIAAEAIQSQDAAMLVAAAQSQLATAIAGVGVLLMLSVLMPVALLYLLNRYVIRPVQRLSVVASAVTSGELDGQVDVNGLSEVGVLQRNFNTMTATIRQQTGALEQQIEAATLARAEAEEARAATALRLDMIEQQRAQIRDMSVPLLPVTDTTVVMPLVGMLDAGRLALIQERALATIERMALRCLILDITGLAVVDTEVIRGFSTIIRAAGLMGVEVVLVGVRPEVAQSLVSFGMLLDDVVTCSTLQAGITYSLRRHARNS